MTHPVRNPAIYLLLLLLMLTACSERVEPPMFNYLACRQSKTLELTKQGVQSVAANMQAMAYCREQQASAR
jgi:hypothetical protein